MGLLRGRNWLVGQLYNLDFSSLESLKWQQYPQRQIFRCTSKPLKARVIWCHKSFLDISWKFLVQDGKGHCQMSWDAIDLIPIIEWLRTDWKIFQQRERFFFRNVCMGQNKKLIVLIVLLTYLKCIPQQLTKPKNQTQNITIMLQDNKSRAQKKKKIPKT